MAEKQKHVKKDSVEILGHYNPHSKEFGLKDEERVKYWLGQHVEVSPTVHNLFVEKGLVAGEKKSAWRPKPKQQDPTASGIEPKAEAGKEAAEGEPRPEGREKPAEPTVEAPAEQANPEEEKKEEKAEPAAESDTESNPAQTKPDEVEKKE